MRLAETVYLEVTIAEYLNIVKQNHTCKQCQTS